MAKPTDAGAAELILGKPWAILPEVLMTIAAEASRGTFPPMAEAPETDPPVTDSTVAVIPLRGSITPRGSLLSLLFGDSGGGLDQFRESLRQAVADDNTSAILLDIDSPGGLIDLVPETAAEIREARGTKPIVAISNTLCASAAYWIAAQADEIVVTPSGQLGSIGVFCVHEDFSRMEEMLGIKTTIISAGEYKTDGNPVEPLSKTAKQALQKQVDDLYNMFTGDVAKGRGVSRPAVQAGFGRGRCVLAAEAVQVGLADRVATFEQTVARLGGTATDPPASLTDLTDTSERPAAHDYLSGKPAPAPEPTANDYLSGTPAPLTDYLGDADRSDVRTRPEWLIVPDADAASWALGPTIREVRLCADRKPSVRCRLSASAVDVIHTEAARFAEFETGGVLFGEPGLAEISVLEAGTAGPRAVHAKDSYRCDAGHDMAQLAGFSAMYRGAAHSARELGSYHSHCVPDVDHPSAADMQGAAAMLEELGLSRWVEVITTPDRVRGWAKPHLHAWVTRVTDPSSRYRSYTCERAELRGAS